MCRATTSSIRLPRARFSFVTACMRTSFEGPPRAPKATPANLNPTWTRTERELNARASCALEASGDAPPHATICSLDCAPCGSLRSATCAKDSSSDRALSSAQQAPVLVAKLGDAGTVRVPHLCLAVGRQSHLEFRRPDRVGRRRVAHDLSGAFACHGCAGAGVHLAADHAVVFAGGGDRGHLGSTHHHAGGADLFAAGLRH